MASKVEVDSIEQFKKMHTGSLMNRRNALLKCEESFEQSDRYGSEEKHEVSETGYIEFKDTPEWRQAYGERKRRMATVKVP